MGNLADTFFSRARSDRDAIALSDGRRDVVFGALASRARCLATSLRGPMGLVRGDRAAIWMENRLEFFELLVGSWAAGLCAVPMNAKLHAKEAAHIVADSDARVVFTSESLVDGLVSSLGAARPAPRVVVAGSAAYEALFDSASADVERVDPAETAWLFYTSGTTGRPKGAMLSHRALLFMSFAYYADIERVEPGDTDLHAAPLSHGSGLYAIPHLFGGGTQVVHSGFDTDRVLEALDRYRNVSLFAAPTMVTRMVDACPTGRDLRGLRTLVYGGGPMYVNDLLAALERFGPRLYQLYGQGESPMTITGLSRREHEGDRGPAHLARLGSCGTPRTGVAVGIVDDAGRRLPPGEPGEVVTRSDCTMSGYWRDADATSAALAGGWLRTGDVGSVDDAGFLTLRDRSKDLVITGGANVYPREVEEILLRHPGVLECSVVGRPHPDWGEEIVAFVVSRPGRTVEPAELDALCLANIARFKRPKDYRFVPTLPKNNYGKVLKTALRTWLASEREAPGGGTAPVRES